MNKYIPGYLLGVLVGTYFQYKEFLEEQLKNEIKQLNEMGDQVVDKILSKLPKYSTQRSIDH